MTEIDSLEEAERDWDWFAVGIDGTIAHFATAGLRVLPKSVKQDRDIALLLIEYFYEEAPGSVPYIVLPEGEEDGDMRYFIRMASAGLFSYDTPVYERDSYYFMVVAPQQPLTVNQLPEKIRNLVMRTQAPYIFAQTRRIRCEDTIDW